jgi:hypothetical protein
MEQEQLQQDQGQQQQQGLKREQDDRKQLLEDQEMKHALNSDPDLLMQSPGKRAKIKDEPDDEDTLNVSEIRQNFGKTLKFDE